MSRPAASSLVVVGIGHSVSASCKRTLAAAVSRNSVLRLDRLLGRWSVHGGVVVLAIAIARSSVFAAVLVSR